MKRFFHILPLAVFALLVVYLAVGLTMDPKVIPSALIDKPVPEFVCRPSPAPRSKGSRTMT